MIGDTKKEIKEFLEYIENFVICVKVPEKRRPRARQADVPAIVQVEFIREDWEHLKETGDWRSLRKRDEQYLREAQAAEGE